MRYVVINTERLADLLRSEIELSALQAGGVDNWDWYGDCFDENTRELLDADNETIIRSEGFTIKDTDDLFG